MTKVAHLKMTYSPGDRIAGETASINLESNDKAPESGMTLDAPSNVTIVCEPTTGDCKVERL